MATLFAFSHSVHTGNNIVSIPGTIQSGDIIFRDGRGAISSIFRNMSLTNQSYSHAGIIHIENNIPFVFHIIGGEGRKSIIRKELLSEFCSNREALSYAIYRTDLENWKIDSFAGELYRQKIMFDTKFDLLTDDKMYCTEFVYKVLVKASGKDNFLPLTTVNNITYCACDNLFLSPHFIKIYSAQTND
jgi:hypothetical protein